MAGFGKEVAANELELLGGDVVGQRASTGNGIENSVKGDESSNAGRYFNNPRHLKPDNDSCDRDGH